MQAGPSHSAATGLELAVSRQTDQIIISLVGELAVANAYLLGGTFCELIDQGHRTFVLDALRLTSCDGAGWTLLLGVRWRLATISGRLRIVDLAPRLMRWCRLMDLVEVFELETTSRAQPV